MSLSVSVYMCSFVGPLVSASVSVYVCLLVSLSVYTPVHPSLRLSARVHVGVPVGTSARLHLSLSPSAHLPVGLFVSVPVGTSVCLAVYVSPSPSVPVWFVVFFCWPVGLAVLVFLAVFAFASDLVVFVSFLSHVSLCLSWWPLPRACCWLKKKPWLKNGTVRHPVSVLVTSVTIDVVLAETNI